jgi:nuclear transport factor 2 (NTF2) superfamily protein
MKNYSYIEHREDGDYEVVVSEKAAIRYSKDSAERYLEEHPERKEDIQEVLSRYTNEEFLEDFIIIYWATETELDVGEYKL